MGRATHYEQPDQYTGVFVVSCDADGTELARNRSQAAAERAGGQTACPCCGSRTAQPHVGVTGVATDQARARGRR